MIFYKQGDSNPSLVCYLQTEAGYTLSGKTVVLTLEKPDGTTVSRSASVLDATTRKVQVDWQATDFADVGDYRGEFVVTASGKERTIPADGYVNFKVIASL
jgi:hypothetical protein